MFSTMDSAIGMFIIVCVVMGLTFNIAALKYFTSMEPRNRNGELFKRIYTIISLNDFFICLGMVPVVETAFSENRDSHLFENTSFCSLWFVYWVVIYNISLVMIALLSLSRYLLIRYPRGSLCHPWLAYIIPGTTLSVLLIILTTSLATQNYPTYYREGMYCFFSAYPRNLHNTSVLYIARNSVVSEVDNGVVFLIFTSSYTIVCVSFVLTISRLWWSGVVAVKVGGTHTQQLAAAKTVSLVSVLFLLFNTPVMTIHVYFLVKVILTMTQSGGTITIRELKDRLSTHLFGDVTVLNYYAILITMVVGTCVNSALNPAIYFFRIRGFRRFVLNIWSRVKEARSLNCNGGLEEETPPRINLELHKVMTSNLKTEYDIILFSTHLQPSRNDCQITNSTTEKKTSI